MSRSPDVSVVVPVFDALPELHATLDSILAASPGPDVRVELLAVDDGSTDGSGAVLDERAAAANAEGRVTMAVRHTEPSGWAGRPRNVALDIASGRYVFFCDADDQVLDGALAAMVAFADEHSCDVVLPKVITTDRYVHEKLWQTSQVDADPALIYRSLIPAKLVRRSLLVEHGIRFAEGRQPLEDGIFISDCYRAAGRISILADRDYYLHTRRRGRGLTSRRREAAPHLEAVERIIENIRATVSDPALAEAIVVDLYRRKALKRMKPELWHRLSPTDRAAWVGGAHDLALGHLPEDADLLMPPRWRRRFLAVRSGSVERVDRAVRVFEQRREARQAAPGETAAGEPGGR